MKKILIAIDNDFIRESYVEIFKREKFKVLNTKDGKKTLELAKKEKPDIILADVLLSGMQGFELLENLRKKTPTKKIPVIIFSQYEKEEDRKKAILLEVKDFITAAEFSPAEVTRRVRIALGEQKSYRIEVSKDLDSIKELIKDLGYGPDLKCQKCGSLLELYLIRDLLVGKNHFIVSFVCPKCE